MQKIPYSLWAVLLISAMNYGMDRKQQESASPNALSAMIAIPRKPLPSTRLQPSSEVTKPQRFNKENKELERSRALAAISQSDHKAARTLFHIILTACDESYRNSPKQKYSA